MSALLEAIAGEITSREADASSGETPAPAPKGRTPARPAAPSPRRPAAGPTPTRPAAGRPTRAGGGAPKGDSTPERIAAIVRAADAPVSRKEIAAQLGLAAGGLSRHFKALLDAGTIRRVGGLKDGGFVATERADAQVAERPQAKKTGATRPLGQLIQQINAAIIADPGLTEQQLAQALDLDREDVAVTCGTLLDREWVTRDPHGGYHPADGSTTGEQGGGTT